MWIYCTLTHENAILSNCCCLHISCFFSLPFLTLFLLTGMFTFYPIHPALPCSKCAPSYVLSWCFSCDLYPWSLFEYHWVSYWLGAKLHMIIYIFSTDCKLLESRDSFIFIEQDIQCHGDRLLMHIGFTGGLNALFHIWNMQVLSLVRKSPSTVNRVLKNIFCSSLYLKWGTFYDSWWVKCRFPFIPALPVKKTLVWLVKSIA